jgi:hypothetical protein
LLRKRHKCCDVSEQWIDGHGCLLDPHAEHSIFSIQSHRGGPKSMACTHSFITTECMSDTPRLLMFVHTHALSDDEAQEQSNIPPPPPPPPKDAKFRGPRPSAVDQHVSSPRGLHPGVPQPQHSASPTVKPAVGCLCGFVLCPWSGCCGCCVLEADKLWICASSAVCLRKIRCEKLLCDSGILPRVHWVKIK